MMSCVGARGKPLRHKTRVLSNLKESSRSGTSISCLEKMLLSAIRLSGRHVLGTILGQASVKIYK